MNHQNYVELMHLKILTQFYYMVMNEVWFWESYLISLSCFFHFGKILTGMLRGLNESTYIKCLGQSLVHSKHSIALLILLIITNVMTKSYETIIIIKSQIFC